MTNKQQKQLAALQRIATLNPTIIREIIAAKDNNEDGRWNIPTPNIGGTEPEFIFSLNPGYSIDRYNIAYCECFSSRDTYDHIMRDLTDHLIVSDEETFDSKPVTIER